MTTGAWRSTSPPTWYQVFPGVDMTMPLSVNWGLSGISPVQAAGRRRLAAASRRLGATIIYNQYFVDRKYAGLFLASPPITTAPGDGYP